MAVESVATCQALIDIILLMYIQSVYTEFIMSKEYRAKVFKSGNSVALRLPKELGLKEGSTMILREERSEFVFKPAEERRKKIDVSGFWGKAAGMVHVPTPKQDFETRPSSLRQKT
jgi:antitoxin VapB